MPSERDWIFEHQGCLGCDRGLGSRGACRAPHLYAARTVMGGLRVRLLTLANAEPDRMEPLSDPSRADAPCACV